MFVVIGYIIIIAAALGGYSLAGGHLGALWQPLELLIIGGAAVGALVAGNDAKTIKATLKALPQLFKANPYDDQFYKDLLSLLYEILLQVRKEGLMSIEGDIEDPSQSPLFNKYPKILHDHHLADFLTDYLRMMVGGNLNTFEIESIMDKEIELHHQEQHLPINNIRALGDGMPAFGIVAAVMGVVHTMGSVGKPPAELGEMIAHALVGTFLGILLAYGFINPLVNKLDQNAEAAAKPFECIKYVLLASINGYAPATALEFGRKCIKSEQRPTFKDLEDHFKSLKNK